MRGALIISWLLFALSWAVPPVLAQLNIYGPPSAWVSQDRQSHSSYDHPYEPAKGPCQ